MPLDFTIAIPTYNGADRLPLVLDRLRSQLHTEALTWEVLIVDNNSTDNTAQVVNDYQAQVFPVPIRYCLEPKQGAAFARQHAVEVASSELIGFLDDDVLPALDWVANAHAFGQAHPCAGAYGGQIQGAFEVTPPENFQRIQSFLAIRERGSEPNLYDPENLSLPPAAAIVIRQSAWRTSVPDQPTLGGKANGVMVQGDDYEPLLYMHKAGWEIWYGPDLHVHHQIPHWRLEKAYLLKLIRGSSLCICHLRLINTHTWQKPIVIAKIMLGSLRRATLHLLRYRSRVRTDLIAACEMELFLSSLASPFYFLKTTLAAERRTP